MTFYLYFAMSIKFSLTRRPHLLLSANHLMERFNKNDPLVIFNKITSSSMTLSEANRYSFRICLAIMKGIFTLNPLAAKDFLPFTFP